MRKTKRISFLALGLLMACAFGCQRGVSIQHPLRVPATVLNSRTELRYPNQEDSINARHGSFTDVAYIESLDPQRVCFLVDARFAGNGSNHDLQSWENTVGIDNDGHDDVLQITSVEHLRDEQEEVSGWRYVDRPTGGYRTECNQSTNSCTTRPETSMVRQPISTTIFKRSYRLCAEVSPLLTDASKGIFLDLSNAAEGDETRLRMVFRWRFEN